MQALSKWTQSKTTKCNVIVLLRLLSVSVRWSLYRADIYGYLLTINNPKRNIWLYEPLGNSGTMNLNLELVRWRCSMIMPLLSSELTASSNFISNSPHNSRILFKSAIAILEHVLKGDYSRIPYKISLSTKK